MSRGRADENPIDGVLLVDKPAGMTSHDVVARVRRAAGTRRVGHTGTLDPAATGLLILCLGNATRMSEFLIGMDKVYEGTLRLGVITDSYDMDGTVTEERPVPPLSLAEVQAAMDGFTGDILQVPPMVSAVKVGGERLYKKARKGEEVEREPRPVTVAEFLALSMESPEVRFVTRCTRGTYVRSLCHDVGQILGCGAVLSSLRRTAVGPHRVENAITLDALDSREAVEERLLPMHNVLDLPEARVRDSAREHAIHGGALSVAHLVAPCAVRSGWVQVKAADGTLLALGEMQPGGFVQPRRVLCGDA
jgi:tRNA pseudouridine55 synthase